MFELNDNVIHKSAGACVIYDIITRNFGNGDQTYYYLKPKFPTKVNSTLEIYLPLDKETLFIRKPMTKSEVLSLISMFPSMEKIWITDAKKRKQMFESIYQSGDIRGICQLVKLLYVEPTFFAKPMSLTDKNFLNRIRTNLFDEFAVALQIKPTEVEDFVRQYLL